MNRLTRISTEALAERLLKYLKVERYNGRITPKHPITARQLTATASKSGVKIDDSDVRAAVHYLVSEKHHFICSTLNGYFYTEDWQEFKESLGHLYSRISELGERIRASEKAIERRANQEQHTESLFDSPKAEALQRELGPLEKV